MENESLHCNWLKCRKPLALEGKAVVTTCSRASHQGQNFAHVEADDVQPNLFRITVHVQLLTDIFCGAQSARSALRIDFFFQGAADLSDGFPVSCANDLFTP